jgi:predicted aconitase with swiveling domain
MNTQTLRGPSGFGAIIEAEALVSPEAFSPRYDLDRATGEISRKGHAIEGHNIAGKILVIPAAKGGVAAGWAFYDLRARGIAPAGLICSTTNPVFVQGCVLAGIGIMHRLQPEPLAMLKTGDLLRMEPEKGCVTILRRAGQSR